MLTFEKLNRNSCVGSATGAPGSGQGLRLLMLQGVEWKYFDEVRVRECVSAYVIHTNNHSDALPEEDLQDQAS